MDFGDLKSTAGVKKLDDFLATKSYIVGYTPSKADATTFEGLGKAPSADYVNALRWYNHILSYGGERNSFPDCGGGAAPAGDDEDDVDLFGSDDEEEDEEAEKLKQERLAMYAAKKAGKKAVIAKSTIVFDVKPWDDETDMAEMEKLVRGIAQDGLLWGASKLVPVGYGIKKLQIGCVVEDDKVSVDMLEEQIKEFEDHVQSVDIAAFNKI
eukprot:TRINITY_DN42317_c0_g1_i1.p1 TRINITY_DN42317_c0_g1~~TRINITY_DN42317_c0_g1_i1.p1  ORF type:complete len:211 (+),score=44.02 TRINITY_DN42317_c0_g1_i1:180-812(+)